ncbi:Hypothetical_protein [Hexamita inflata]|uniref:Hypothetical_protein n=1 Tax=Hexamita inflata TaxID=28002 RepID=A0AA86NNG0_9EUKA|nr:Hypothetical protein HINF_LOCUS10885 [Hexamita inflata]
MRYQFSGFDALSTFGLVFLFVLVHLSLRYAICFAMQYKSGIKSHVCIFECVQRAIITSLTFAFYKQCKTKPSPNHMRDRRDFYHARTTQMIRFQLQRSSSVFTTADY